MGSPTNNANLQLPTVGGETGTWGTNLNNNTITPIDQLFGSVQAITITSADVNITTTQFQNAIFNLTGGLTGNRNLFVPVGAVSTTTGAGGRFIVTNNTSNAFTVTVNTTLAGAVGTVVPQGGRSYLYCDGTNVKSGSFGDLTGCFVTTVTSSPQGQLAGTAGSSAVGLNTQLAYDVVNNNLYACTTTGASNVAVWTQPTLTVTRGFDTAINLQLSAAVSSNILTVSVLTSSGATPTAANPVAIVFPDNTVANGDPSTVNITGALSIATSSGGGSTFNSQNAVPFRLWIVGFNNSGTAALGLVNCISTSNQIFPINEAGVASATAMSTTANAAGTIYSSSAVGAIASKSFRILGYLTYETALATAGVYNNAPDVVRLFGPGIKKPGDVVQFINTISSATSSIAGNSTSKKQTGTTASLTPTSKANPIFAQATGIVQSNGGGSQAFTQLSRGTTTFGSFAFGPPQTVVSPATVVMSGYDFPAATTPTNYYVNIFGSTAGSNADTLTWLGSVQGYTAFGSITLQELMG